MKCPQCQFDNPAGMKFCGQCGGKLGAVCRRCGNPLVAGFRFCGECGAPIGEARGAGPAGSPSPEPAFPGAVKAYTPPHLAEQVLRSDLVIEGERKRVTVLFCDVVSSTSLADRLGPEVMHGLLSRFFELALGEVHRFEGTINQFLGDGFMALFGAPVAHEDHARRAVFTAFALRRRLAEPNAFLSGDLGERQRLELNVRMGINTGLVVVGGIGDRLRMDYTAVGDTTNLAARLQQLATPGSILVSEATARLVREHVDLEAQPPAAVKGKAEPVQAYRVLATRASPGLESSAEEAVTPFVGRERELAALAELAAQAAAGEGQVVGIAGEAGAGKSRLLQEFLRRLAGSVQVLAGRCISYGGDVPYLPFLYMLRSAWGIAEAESAEAAREKILDHLIAAGTEVETAAPLLLRLVGIPEEAPHLAELSPQALKTRTFTVLGQALLGRRDSLSVLVVEDLHWVDETSEQLLSHLVGSLAGTRVLLVVTYRSGYQPRFMDRSYATQLSMRRLSVEESSRLVSAMLCRAPLSAELLQLILEKAEGNPFFLEELTRSVVERGSEGDLAVPDTVQGVLMARIDRLPESHKRLLQTASVLGRELSLDVLRPLWSQDSQPETLDLLLADLRRWEFVYESTLGASPVYLFRHALTQEAVYESLLTSRRKVLHAAAGHILETLHASRLEEVYDTLVFHFARSGRPADAVRYLTLSAARAARGYAHLEAERSLREALRQAAQLPPPESHRQQVEVSLQLAESLLPLARFPETLELLSGQAETVEHLDDLGLTARYFFWCAHTHSYLGNQAAAAVAAERAIGAARQAGDTATEGRARYVLSRDGFWSGHFASGIEQGLLAVDLLERAGERWWAGQAHWVVGFLRYVLGQFDAALESMGRTQEIWRALEDPRLDGSWSIGYFLTSLGRVEEGLAECRSGLARARDPLNRAVAQGFLGYAYLEKGQLALALEALQGSVPQLRAAGMQQLQGWFSAFLGEAHLAEGRLVEARELAEEGLDAAREARFGYGMGLALRTLGRVAHAAGDLPLAERRLAEALDTFKGLGIPLEEARTRLERARLARDRGRPEEADREIGLAVEQLTILEVSVYVRRATALAEELSASGAAGERRCTLKAR